jgi:asparagine synthase (glutamine-hydrolysing)
MCGINLIIDQSHKIDNAVIAKMAYRTRHRGPDETRIVVEKSNRLAIHMAANRLKITEHAKLASQPFSIGTTRKYLLFNGEIYNYRHLKNKLLDFGVHFHSDSDTEVLFHWMSIFGKVGLSVLEGMFALAFIDLENEEILIARDRSGIKTIYYYDAAGLFIASSELKPIAECGLYQKRLNTRQINHYLCYKYAAPPETFFEGIFELSPGSVLHFKNHFWEKSVFSNVESQGSLEIIDLRAIEELITCSLLDQLERKVPTGLLLSGGVDSTVLLALAHKNGISMPTFSVVGSEKENASGTEDGKYSRIAASLYKSNHHELLIDRTVLKGFDDFIDSVDQPIGDSSYLLTSEICKYASGSMKVLLSGAGADELFGGYNRHWAFFKYLEHRKLLDHTVPVLQSALRVLPEGFPTSWNKKVGYLHKLIKSYDSSPERTWMNFIAFNDFVNNSMPSGGLGPSTSWMDWALLHDRNHYLVSDVLALTDKASMLHGLEVRVPYLDDRIINYLGRIDSRLLMKHGRKWVLRNILIDNGGARIANRAKEGFGLPLGSWLNDKNYNYILRPLLRTDGMIFEFIDKQISDRLICQHQEGRKDNSPQLWSLLILAHWLERNF